MSEWHDDALAGCEQRWTKCPECKGQGHWFNGVSIRICPRCSNEGEVREMRIKPAAKQSGAKESKR